jgi:hypothetical protein
MRIPEIQLELRRLAQQNNLPELEKLADELSRRKATRRASKQSTPVSLVKDSIISTWRANPELPLSRIAVAHNVNPGRVSEIISGFRS